MRGFFNNPITNPFYRDPRDQQPDGLVENESRAGSVLAGTDGKNETTVVEHDSESIDGQPTKEYQDGLKKVEAIAITWGKQSLIATYVSIYLVFFLLSLQQQSANSYTPYVYSDFALHSLVSISSIMSYIIGGVLRLPTAKLIDIWGRAEGFMVMVFFTVLGIILMATCNNVQTYAAAQVIYWIGNDGIQYVLDVVIADTSKLKNRGLMLSFSTTPYIATTFAGPALAQRFLAPTGAGWRWGFGMFAIIIPVIAIPLSVIFLLNEAKARKAGLIQKIPSGRTWLQSIKHYAIEFDVAGMLIIMAGLVMFLLPFSLAAYETEGWHSPTIIGLIVVGACLLLFFPFFELYISPKSFIPWRLLSERTVLGACLTIGSLFVSFYCWDLYFLSYLQVVYGLSVSDAGYLANTYSIGSCFWGVIVGLLIRQTGRYKWLAMCAVPLHILGAGLMIHFRQPDVNIGYVVMCQIFIAFAGGTLVLCHQIAALAATKHGDIAVVLALLSLSAAVGAAIGSAVSGAIWTNTFESVLVEALPAATKSQAASIYAMLQTQLSYPMGDPTRDAIIYAYGVAQKRMCIASVSISILALVGVWMWKDIRVDNKKQVKGTVV